MTIKTLSLLYSPAHRNHRPKVMVEFGEARVHPDSVRRIENILSALRAVDSVAVSGSRRQASSKQLCAVHDAEFVRFLTSMHNSWEDDWPLEVVPDTFRFGPRTRMPHWALAQLGFYCFDTATPVGAQTVKAAKLSAGCAAEAAEQLLDGSYSLVYALCRPPGHHAGIRRFGGFCYFNNCALAAARLSSCGRVGILDLDFHHGNGTQDIFYRTDRVLFVSIHADPNHSFPYFSGYREERGEMAGEGFTVNFPLSGRVDSPTYLVYLMRALDCIVGRACEFLIISLGYDTCRGDPLGGFLLEPSDYWSIGQAIASLRMPTLVVQEGGYALESIGSCAAEFVAGLLS